MRKGTRSGAGTQNFFSTVPSGKGSAPPGSPAREAPATPPVGVEEHHSLHRCWSAPGCGWVGVKPGREMEELDLPLMLCRSPRVGPGLGPRGFAPSGKEDASVVDPCRHSTLLPCPASSRVVPGLGPRGLALSDEGEAEEVSSRRRSSLRCCPRDVG